MTTLRRCRPLLGTFVEIDAPDYASMEAGFAAVEKIHELMSAHRSDSDVGRINRRAHIDPVPVSDPTIAVLQRAIGWSRRSNGIFDVVRAGGQATSFGEIPRFTDTAEPDPAASWRDLHLRAGCVCLARPAYVDLGGIAKGFAVDEAIEAMRREGAKWGLVNAGGDLRGFGERSWEVTVVDPRTRTARAVIALSNSALATSAGRGGRRAMSSFRHLPRRDPRWSSVTVQAADACDADALTKIAIASDARSTRLLADAGARAFGIEADGRVSELLATVPA